jgi:ubiquinone/menaquinone biosynthesis C-methylase UbiE
MSLYDYLINQSRKPKGFVGKIMLNIMNNAHKSIFQFGIENINIVENINLLDLGFGGGKALRLLSKKYDKIKLFGIDFSEEAIKAANKNNKNDIQTGKIKLLQADIKNIPFSDNYFEIITAFQTHYHWENLPNKIKEVYRVLNNNGQFIIVAEKYKINYHMKEYKTKDEVIKLFNDLGFKGVEYKKEKNNVCVIGVK